MSLRILLTGGSGQLGWELQRTLAPRGEVRAPGRDALDLRDLEAVREAVRQIQPDLVVNAAAYNDVDGAESEPEAARRVNAEAPGALAEEAAHLGIPLIHYSTDYVFGGEKRESYTENDEPNPVNTYGRSKLEGERAVAESDSALFIFRLSWIYGPRRSNFVTTMLRLFRERNEIGVVDDQRGSPTWCRTPAEVTAQLLAAVWTTGGDIVDSLREHDRLYHLAASGSVTRFEQARAIQRHAHRLRPDAGYNRCELHPIPASEYPTDATRPRSTPLSSIQLERRFGLSLTSWEEDLRRCLEDMFARAD